MRDLITVEDDLDTARDFVLAVFMAAGSLHRDQGGPIQAVANEALHRIMDARALVRKGIAEAKGEPQGEART